ncbi:MAG: HigA family addiction module antitoxin [Verrucomicrobiota bacterium]
MTDSNLIPLENFFAETLAETLEEWPATQAQVARATGIPAPHLSAMKAGNRRCTPEYDLRLGRYFGISPGYWMRLQLSYDMDAAERSKGEVIKGEVHEFQVA